MKKLLLSTILATGLTSSAYAGMLGLDWEATGEYNVDTEASTLKTEVGKSINLSGLTLTADLDFDIIETEFLGSDYKASIMMPGMSNVEVYAKTGLDKTWERENIIAGITFSW